MSPIRPNFSKNLPKFFSQKSENEGHQGFPDYPDFNKNRQDFSRVFESVLYRIEYQYYKVGYEGRTRGHQEGHPRGRGWLTTSFAKTGGQIIWKSLLSAENISFGFGIVV